MGWFRKILILINVLSKDDEPWRSNKQQKLKVFKLHFCRCLQNKETTCKRAHRKQKGANRRVKYMVPSLLRCLLANLIS